MSESKFPQGPSKKDPSKSATPEQEPPVQESPVQESASMENDETSHSHGQVDDASIKRDDLEAERGADTDASETKASVEPAPTVNQQVPHKSEVGSDRGASTHNSAAAASPPTKAAPSKARVGGLAAVVAVVVSAAMVGAAGYYAWQQQEQIEAELVALQSENQQQQQMVAELKRALQQTGSEVQTAIDSQLTDVRQQVQQQLQSQIQQQDTQINRLKDRIDGHQQRLTNLSTTSREDWLLAEAEYLLKLANQRVLLERLPSNAIALLQAADAIVREVAGGMGDAELFAVREALADELAALKLVEPIDKEGIYLQLNSLARAVDDLPRVPSHSFGERTRAAGADKAPPTADAEIADEWWRRLWREIKEMAGILDDYIKIEDAEAPAKPLVDQYTSQAAVLNVRLLLEQAQVALLKEQPVAYRQSLQQAQTMIKEYFISSAPAREVLQSLEQLEAIEIAPQLPNISRSLKMLNRYVQQLHKLQPADEGQL